MWDYFHVSYFVHTTFLSTCWLCSEHGFGVSYFILAIGSRSRKAFDAAAILASGALNNNKMLKGVVLVCLRTAQMMDMGTPADQITARGRHNQYSADEQEAVSEAAFFLSRMRGPDVVSLVTMPTSPGAFY